MTNEKKNVDNTKSKIETSELMVVHDDPGVETRIAILEGGRLEELYTERAKQATGVGNIYKGRVTNVEPAIQAAFVEYGGPQSGFLHVTDLHPKYFPGKEIAEKVGKKIAKHNRPPIQKCLRKGDEILVQVLKEGIGTKGPTLTSYLSIPGRLSVMMPYMDKFGVSRKIEDEDTRRNMRKVLDSINLPKGFGFILRTAGLNMNKTEIKRDIAYLIRLWKMIEKRISNVGAPCQLYNESDLLVRTIRDVLRPSIDAIVVDSKSGYDRISSFLKIAAPRSSRKIIYYNGASPIFHAYDLERQIEEVHSREVGLPSGGRLVIDQTEALVAIDVNSGKSRGARNSETNALNTNLEAADEICRQLRLRDLGGIVINDLIDMGKSANRRKVEKKFQDNLERDRARSTVLPISKFGLLEMTRQRIRPSVLDSHYVACSHCDGRGNIKTIHEVSADATRHCGWLLHHDRVRRVELTCSPAVGTYLLSNQRGELNKYETISKKKISVRISEELATDRLVYYAYDERGADIDLDSLPVAAPPTLSQLIKQERLSSDDDDPGSKSKPKRSRRRGRSKLPIADAADISGDESLGQEIASLTKKKSKVKRNKPKRKSVKETAGDSALRVHQFAKSIGKSSKEIIALCKAQGVTVRNHMSTMTTELATKLTESFEKDSEPKKPRRRRRPRKNVRNKVQKRIVADKTKSSDKQPVSKASSKKSSNKKRSRKRSTRANGRESTKVETKTVSPKKPRRTLYGGSRRSVTADEIQASMDDRA